MKNGLGMDDALIVLEREPAFECKEMRRLCSMSAVSCGARIGGAGSGGGGGGGDAGVGESMLAGDGFVGSGEAMSAMDRSRMTELNRWEPLSSTRRDVGLFSGRRLWVG